MLNHVFFLICVQQTLANIPNYVHLHTSEEIMETNYVILHKLNLCKDFQYTNSQLFIAIKSSTKNSHQRQLVRQTWLPEVLQYHIPYVFVLGSTNDGELLEKLLEEDKQYHDLIIGRFVDDYYNLTLKSIFTLTWTKVYCPTRWLLYTDDDAIINVENIVQFIASVKDLLNRNVFCEKGPRRVHREFDSKWYVPESVWPKQNYPEFCYGWGYLIPSNTLPLLQNMLADNKTKPKLWIEDVFVTGIATKAAGIKVVQAAFACCNLRYRHLFKTNMVLGQMGKDEDFLESWTMVQGKTILSQRKEPKYYITKNDISSFDRNGLLMGTSKVINETLLNTLPRINYMSSSNRSYFWHGILVILFVILLYLGLSQQILLRLIENLFNIENA
ncbi:hypothetical protein I4U23_015303 [Adineta vaga]|nr:hypothetical protein I4U23_015303 [Adineta vaga]